MQKDWGGQSSVHLLSGRSPLPRLAALLSPQASMIPVPLRIPSQMHVAPSGTYCLVMSLIASCATRPPRRAAVCGNVECGVARVLYRPSRPATDS